MITIYHNPRCGKSREALAFLASTNEEVEVIKYLERPLTFDNISELIQKLDIHPIDLVRKKEKIWIDQFKEKKLNADEIILALVAHPILIERPIAVKGNKAVIARPFDQIKTIL